MGQVAVTGAFATCTFGVAPAAITAIPVMVTVEKKPVVRATDIAPMANVGSFGMCTTQVNPAVAAATAAALGVPTPAPCVPNVAGPWTATSPTVTVGGVPVVTSSSMCMCAWTGVIRLGFAGSVQTTTPP